MNDLPQIDHFGDHYVVRWSTLAPPTTIELNNNLGSARDDVRRNHSIDSKRRVTRLSQQLVLPTRMEFPSYNQIEWWTNGLNIHDTQPSISVDRIGLRYRRYETGQDPNPAFPEYEIETQRGYYQCWRKMVGDKFVLSRHPLFPALIDIHYARPRTDHVIWAAISNNFHENTVGLFKDDTRVHWDSKVQYLYYVDGKPAWADKPYHVDMLDRVHMSHMMGDSYVTHRYVNEMIYEWSNGIDPLHRENGPAIVKLRGVKEIEHNNKVVSSTWKSWESVWVIRGKDVPHIDVIEWCRRNNIVINDGPCHDRSAFLYPADELKFLTGFVDKIK